METQLLSLCLCRSDSFFLFFPPLSTPLHGRGLSLVIFHSHFPANLVCVSLDCFVISGGGERAFLRGLRPRLTRNKENTDRDQRRLNFSSRFPVSLSGSNFMSSITNSPRNLKILKMMIADGAIIPEAADFPPRNYTSMKWKEGNKETRGERRGKKIVAKIKERGADDGVTLT